MPASLPEAETIGIVHAAFRTGEVIDRGETGRPPAVCEISRNDP
jgi:hypothetical protein